MGQSCPDSTTSFRPPWLDHQYTIHIDGKLYGSQFDDYPEDQLDEAEFTVSFALRGSLRRFVYEYDFGDSWTHEVLVENVAWTPYMLKHGVCLHGGGACPPPRTWAARGL